MLLSLPFSLPKPWEVPQIPPPCWLATAANKTSHTTLIVIPCYQFYLVVAHLHSGSISAVPWLKETHGDSIPTLWLSKAIFFEKKWSLFGVSFELQSYLKVCDNLMLQKFFGYDSSSTIFLVEKTHSPRKLPCAMVKFHGMAYDHPNMMTGIPQWRESRGDYRFSLPQFMGKCWPQDSAPTEMCACL